MVAKTVQRTHLAVIQHDTHSVLALLFVEFPITGHSFHLKCKADIDTDCEQAQSGIGFI